MYKRIEVAAAGDRWVYEATNFEVTDNGVLLIFENDEAETAPFAAYAPHSWDTVRFKIDTEKQKAVTN